MRKACALRSCVAAAATGSMPAASLACPSNRRFAVAWVPLVKADYQAVSRPVSGVELSTLSPKSLADSQALDRNPGPRSAPGGETNGRLEAQCGPQQYTRGGLLSLHTGLSPCEGRDQADFGRSTTALAVTAEQKSGRTTRDDLTRSFMRGTGPLARTPHSDFSSVQLIKLRTRIALCGIAQDASNARPSCNRPWAGLRSRVRCKDAL